MKNERPHLYLVSEHVPEEQANSNILVFMNEELRDQERHERTMLVFSLGLHKIWTEVLLPLEADQADLVWGLLHFEGTQGVAERLGISVEEAYEIRRGAEQKLGGRLPFE